MTPIDSAEPCRFCMADQRERGEQSWEKDSKPAIVLPAVGDLEVGSGEQRVSICHLSLCSQLSVAYRTGQVEGALSVGFLLCWVSGGLTGFRGCYLTHHIPLQIFTAIFYVNMDITMLSQFTYYKLKNQKEKLFVFLVCCPLPRPAALHTRAMIEISGFVCGHISCIFYLGSPSSTIGNLFKDSITRKKVSLSLLGTLCPLYVSYFFR
ncbi:PREDICTED: putative uncharacterized protein PQLC2L [Ceratotherium simum simum]|uniref:Uncharacterized protein n=1 Tax=Ceratotherium simum simum TaxID=73337 RepID=A0ABM1DIT4_CERSS|nr:PREDICTED: putative uncharacterized protein PQLC2L [Ceratotherium simum simum]